MQETSTVTYWNRWSLNRRLAFGIVAVIATAYLWSHIFGMNIKVSAVLVAQIFLYILLFHRPVWAMAALIAGQLTLATYSFPLAGQMISIRFFWAVLTLLLLVPILRQKGGVKLGSQARRIIIPAVIFFCIAFVSNFLYTDLSNTMQYLRTNITALVIIILLPATVKNKGDIKRLALVALIICSGSAIYALRQTIMHGGRVGGLTGSAVYQGFDLPVILLPTLAVYAVKGVTSGIRKLILLLVIIMVIALYFTYTRTGIYSLIPGIMIMAFMMKGKTRIGLLLAVLILGSAFILYTQSQSIQSTQSAQATASRYSQGFGENTSTNARLVLWQAALNIALDNPILGIGDSRFKSISQEYTSTISASNQGAVTALGTYEAHNDFLAVWTSFGTLALLDYLWIFVGIFRNFMEARRHSRNLFLKGFAIGCMGALIAYIVNAATHNVMSSSMLLWILAGFSIATVKVARNEQVTKVKEAI